MDSRWHEGKHRQVGVAPPEKKERPDWILAGWQLVLTQWPSTTNLNIGRYLYKTGTAIYFGPRNKFHNKFTATFDRKFATKTTRFTLFFELRRYTKLQSRRNSRQNSRRNSHFASGSETIFKNCSQTFSIGGHDLVRKIFRFHLMRMNISMVSPSSATNYDLLRNSFCRVVVDSAKKEIEMKINTKSEKMGRILPEIVNHWSKLTSQPSDFQVLVPPRLVRRWSRARYPWLLYLQES